MFDTSKLQTPAPLLTKDVVASTVSQELVFEHFGLSLENLGERFCSPFRPDSKPDCKILYSKSGKLLFYDPAAGLSLDMFDLPCYLMNMTFVESLSWLFTSFKDSPPLTAGRLSAINAYKRVAKQKTVLQIASEPHRKTDMEWWAQFNIKQRELLVGRVYRVTDYWLNGEHYNILGAARCYAYGEEDGYKIYRPEAEKRYKWLSTTKALAGYDLLPQTGDLLVITSSKKDVLNLYSFGIPAVAPQGEGMDIDANTLWILKQRFKQVIIFYDNDAPGIAHAKDKAAKWGLDGFIYLPEDCGAKDPSDYCKLHGAAAELQLIKTLLPWL